MIRNLIRSSFNITQNKITTKYFLNLHKTYYSTYTAAMENKKISGTNIAKEIREEIKKQVTDIKETKNVTPGLAVVIVGERKDSQTYVRMKKNAAEEAGFNFLLEELPESISEEDLLKSVQKLNNEKSVHGLLVQLPLPSHISEKTILDAVSFEKDVDGFHPQNIGCLAMKGREPNFVSCTPKGCIEILERSGIQIEGKHAVILGRSNIVGIPVSLLLLERNATVTICHSRTPDLAETCSKADILVAAVGQAKLVKKDWIKEGAIVLDVGINSVDDASRKAGYRLVGDVDFEDVIEKVSKITPVPGGIGPMTVAMLLQNTLKGCLSSIAE